MRIEPRQRGGSKHRAGVATTDPAIHQRPHDSTRGCEFVQCLVDCVGRHDAYRALLVPLLAEDIFAVAFAGRLALAARPLAGEASAVAGSARATRFSPTVLRAYSPRSRL